MLGKMTIHVVASYFGTFRKRIGRSYEVTECAFARPLRYRHANPQFPSAVPDTGGTHDVVAVLPTLMTISSSARS